MDDPTGFLRVDRLEPPKRPISERVRDYRHVHRAPAADDLRLQASRCMDCGVPFCITGCPLGNLIPDWNDLTYRDQWKLAHDRLHLTNNFPEFTGMLCPAPCEASCVLSINDAAVTIKEIELSIVNRAFDEGWIAPEVPTRRTGRRAAVVGSGPAGLAAAQQLNRAGHSVTVFEKEDRIGGLLRYGIPDFKLEKWVIDRRIDVLRAEGIELVTDVHVGVNLTTETLRRDFDAVLLTVGALQGREFLGSGRELKGVHPAMDYLVQQNRRVAGDPVDPAQAITAAGKHVTIVGGGDTSADCLGNIHREGVRSVQVLTHGLQPPNSSRPLEWPDWPFVLRTYPAHEEGGERRWQLTVTGLSGDNRVERIHLAEAQHVNGQIKPVPGTEHSLPTNLVLVAIGFNGPVRDRLLQDLSLDLTLSGGIATDECYRTSVPGVYAAGDARRGASLIVWAIADGRRAAHEIDRALGGEAIDY